MKKLNARQRRFVAEYLMDLNPGAAALRAGYSRRNPRDARIVAWQLLQRPEIATAVAEREGQLLEELGVNAVRVMMQTARIAFLNPRDLLNSDGTLRPLEEIDDDALAGVASIETVEGQAGRRQKLRLRDTIRALALLTRQLELMYPRTSPADELASLPDDFERFRQEEEELAEFRRQAAGIKPA